MVRTTETLPADHFIPQRFIKQLSGFNKLTAEQQQKILNQYTNLQGLPQPMNSSKGGKLPADWVTFRGQPLHPDYVRRNREIQPGILEELQGMVDSFHSASAQKPEGGS